MSLGQSLKVVFRVVRSKDIKNWLVVWNMFYCSIYIGNNSPNSLIFFRGVETTNQKKGKKMAK
jgi:hypothetical protein